MSPGSPTIADGFRPAADPPDAIGSPSDLAWFIETQAAGGRSPERAEAIRRGLGGALTFRIALTDLARFLGGEGAPC